MLNTNCHRNPHARDIVPSGDVEILDLFAVPELEDGHPDHFKWAVITLWQWGQFHSSEAIFWLQIGRHISANAKFDDPDVYMRNYVFRERARADGEAA